MPFQEKRDLDCIYSNRSLEFDIINILEFLIDNIFVFFGGRVFQQTVGIPMGTNCAPLLSDLFLFSYEADFIQGLLKKNDVDDFSFRELFGRISGF
jgi:hypothetical protein